MIIKKCQEFSLVDLCKSWGVTVEQFDEFLDKATETLEQESCEDAINRKATLAEFKRLYYDDKAITRCAELVINGMPPVNPQKVGHWIVDKKKKTIVCDKCNTWFNLDDRLGYMKNCPYCRAKMTEGSEE